MQALLLVGLAFLVLGNSRPSTPAPPPQQTKQDTTKGQSTGQVVADVAIAAMDLFKAFLAKQG